MQNEASLYTIQCGRIFQILAKSTMYERKNTTHALSHGINFALVVYQERKKITLPDTKQFYPPSPISALTTT